MSKQQQKSQVRLTDFSQLAALAPANRAAAVVTQGSAEPDPGLSDTESKVVKRKTLLKLRKQLEVLITKTTDKVRRKQLVDQMSRLNVALGELRLDIKQRNIARAADCNRCFNDTFYDVAKRRLPGATFQALTEEAVSIEKAAGRRPSAAPAPDVSGYYKANSAPGLGADTLAAIERQWAAEE
jgi:hypothetical protein